MAELPDEFIMFGAGPDERTMFRGKLVYCFSKLDRLPVFEPEFSEKSSADYVLWLADVTTKMIFEAVMAHEILQLSYDATPGDIMVSLISLGISRLRDSRQTIRAPLEMEMMVSAPKEHFTEVVEGSKILEAVLQEIDDERSA